MSHPDAVDWQRVQDLVDLIRANANKLPDDSKAALKRSLTDRKDLSTVLVSLSVLDAVALNCGREVRAYLASPKWMKRCVQNCLERPFTARATAQLLVNWEHVFKGEELGAAAHATRRQLQAAMGAELPRPNHFARQMRELIEQQIPLVAFQRGMDFPAAFPIDQGAPQPQPQPAQPARSSPGGWLGFGAARAPGAVPSAPAPAHSASPPAPLQSQGEQLGRMQSDASSLEQCVRSVEALLGGRASGSAEQELARGGDAAHRCRQWRATIRAWVAEETSDRALEELLQMNDRLLALVSQWQAVSEELQAQRQHRGEQPRTPTPLPEARPDHAQWFSPLGSSATRIMPLGESTPNGSSNGGSSRQSHARPGTSPTGNPFGAWPLEQATPTAPTPAAAGAVRMGSADSTWSAGSRGAQQGAPMAAQNTAHGNGNSPGYFWSTSAAQDAVSDTQAGNGAAPSAQQPDAQQSHNGMSKVEAAPWSQPGHTSAPLVEGQWEGFGQKPSAHSPFPKKPAASMQPASVALTGAPHMFPEQHKQGGLQAELSALKQQLEEERGSKHSLNLRLQEAARAEQALTEELRALHLQLRGGETGPAKELERQRESAHGSMMGDPGTRDDAGMSYAMVAYSRQPALRVRFTASHFGAVASTLYNR